MSMTRHSIRKVAFQLLFALASNPETEIDALYEQLRQDDEHLPQEMPAYLLELTQGVAKQADELDAVITSYLNNQWSLARLNKTDLLLLRLAIYEIKYVSTIPAKVAVDEALQLAKEFSDEKSRRFINGILSNLIEKNEED
ncbi:transcription antitermination factor NusB [Liquorilactobacillus satsumensis]|uniref:transcription antitermination factor NusB n=1 Tax=Liquorilactobacillus satsumensis TaxID=259059 RepID=UPI0021C4C4B3|nr:transcription antitermination factor NusB [Liquorilactobacillus satsumensis]MCP9327740.1 transcription antitermination factor NusB [Liquorilactobacillus satsumensis]